MELIWKIRKMKALTPCTKGKELSRHNTANVKGKIRIYSPMNQRNSLYDELKKQT